MHSNTKSPAKQAGRKSPASNGREILPGRLVDVREQLINDRAVGPINEVSIPAEQVCRIHGVLFDIDPRLLSNRVAPEAVRDDPVAFYETVVRGWLENHPVFATAEVRVSGVGLHIILFFSEPVALETDSDSARWSAAIRVVQRALPTDPQCPGITALTRPVGSINGKNGGEVILLKSGIGVAPQAVLEFCGQLRRAPFATIGCILFGGGSVSPCPFCQMPGSRFKALPHSGVCYGSCGKLAMSQLFSLIYSDNSNRGGD